MRISDDGPPGARFTSRNVIALTRNSTTTPCTRRWNAMRSVCSSSRLFLQPPLRDVVHVVAQIEVRDTLEIRVDHVDLLWVPQEDVRQIVGHEGLQVGHRLLALREISLGLDRGQQTVQFGILETRDIEA